MLQQLYILNIFKCFSALQLVSASSCIDHANPREFIFSGPLTCLQRNHQLDIFKFNVISFLHKTTAMQITWPNLLMQFETYLIWKAPHCDQGLYL